MAVDGPPLESWLEESGALKRGHFQLSSGLHSPAYVQCALLLEEPLRARAVGAALGRQLTKLGANKIISPALGGLIIGFAVASALELPFQFVERVEGRMTLRRGFSLKHGDRVVIVEDVVTTGKSTNEAMEVVRSWGAEVCGMASILDRTGGTNPFDVPFVSLMELDLPTYQPADCPLCAAGEGIDKPGSRPIP